MYESWWRCFLQNLWDAPLQAVIGLQGLGVLAVLGLWACGFVPWLD